MSNLYDTVEALCARVKNAAPAVARLSTKQRNDLLEAMAASLQTARDAILAANAKDLEQATRAGLPASMLDRLELNDARLAAISASIRKLIALPDPVGSGETWTMPSGIRITRERVPLGVIAVIYEARPNVTADAAALCLKAGNAVVLRGGKEAILTNTALVNAFHTALASQNVTPDALGFITETDRESAMALMEMRQYVDVLIPRGGRGLIRSTTENAKMPVIETGAGNCHLYVDEYADLNCALRVAVNAKCSRPSVCNAVETLLVHAGIAAEFLPKLAEAVAPYHVELRGCRRTCILVPGTKPATEEDWDTEYNDYILAVRVVDTIDDALQHIRTYSTRHSEAIITQHLPHATRFQEEVDAAAVYVNASTRFTDGEEFGFGAEIGISTQKLHVRGPMGLTALTTEKYKVVGDGAVR